MPYLFSYFTREDTGGEQVFFSVSRDGLHWQDLSDKPALIWNKGDKGVRDPYVVKHPVTGEFYVMATDLSIHRRHGDWDSAVQHGSRDLVFWSSHDLVHWSEPWAVTLAPEGAGCAWAPEAIWDEKAQAFLIYFASYTHYNGESKQRIHAAHTNNFRVFSPVFKYIEWDDHVIDTTIIQEGGMFYRFSASNDIKVDCGPELTGAFTPMRIPAVESLVGVEGPACYRLPDGHWCLIVDYIRKSAGYIPVVLDDVAAGKVHIIPEDQYDFGSMLKRHGGVLAITDDEYDRLLQYAESLS